MSDDDDFDDMDDVGDDDDMGGVGMPQTQLQVQKLEDKEFERSRISQQQDHPKTRLEELLELELKQGIIEYNFICQIRPSLNFLFLFTYDE
jgi:hypothetical protein